MNSTYTHIFFVGIGGIGMSALARYFRNRGLHVAGYDKTETALTRKMESEGFVITYTDDVSTIPKEYLEGNCRIIYTPAIPKSNKILEYFKETGYTLVKRAKVLGEISSEYKTVAVAGAHGKTTISILIAYLLNKAGVKVNAILGGISLDFNSNMLWNEDAEVLVTEADEYDQSFLQLHPDVAIITSVDADHLDIYGESREVLNSYQNFAKQVDEGGILISKADLMEHFPLHKETRKISYSFGEKTDYSAMNVHVSQGKYIFDIVTPEGVIEEMECGLAGRHNVENAIAALAVCIELKADVDKLRDALSTFKGVNRRFDVHYKKGNKIYIDDYAHHPTELNILIQSVRDLYPNLKVTGIFQPHLYSRTRDFADDFAQSLSRLDELILLDIYPAREEPLEGIDSHWLLEKVKVPKKEVCSLTNLLQNLKEKNFEVLLTIGAGNIDKMVEPIKEMLKKDE